MGRVFAHQDEDPLTAIPLLIRVFQDVQHMSLSDEEHDLFEPDAAVGLQLLVLRVIPGEIFHRSESIKVCAFKAHIRRSELCPFLCPLTLECGVFWYEMLIREKGELMAGFIGPSRSVRLSVRSRRRNC